VSLLHPYQACELLQLCSSTADADLLLLSQLCQPGGLSAAELVTLQQQLTRRQQRSRQPQQPVDTSSMVPGVSSSSSGSNYLAVTPYTQQLLLQLLEQLPSVSQGVRLPLFPSPLRADVARAAVGAYLRAGSLTRATAVAHAAAVAHPRDVQQYDLLQRGAAAAGAALPALVVTKRLRQALWQLPAPRAQAAMLRCVQHRRGAGLVAGGSHAHTELDGSHSLCPALSW
jgi:hypothetical protein